MWSFLNSVTVFLSPLSIGNLFFFFDGNKGPSVLSRQCPEDSMLALYSG